ncbi:TspO/MBR family protein [Gryllotalpicola protaetiae]|uniref:Tryptophan-rich sensory protein n=1 Tax=Gryllotalpicola protaetiae TaxID=2419771 RepID=A0A387BI28_9MICO|nr:TspO/MBR family protein [Gryllotalpicola protaetiae]AYG02338.1 tryptophan-rich sensory protein [Gryllotalpicola protaetiae]
MTRWGLVAAAATAASALVGTVGTRPKNAWYRALKKPVWQPPPWAFPLAWTPLYVSIAWSASRSLRAAPAGSRRRTYAAALTGDLVLNAGWCWAFFAARSLPAGLATIVALDGANLALIDRTARLDRAAAAALLPYVAWTGFATVLNLALWRRN